MKIPRTGKRQAPVSGWTSATGVEACSGPVALTSSTSTTLRARLLPFDRPAPFLLAQCRHLSRDRGAAFATQFVCPALLEIFSAARCEDRILEDLGQAAQPLLPRFIRDRPPRVDSAEPARVEVPPLKIAFSEREEPGRSASSLRAPWRLPADLDWTASIYADDPGEVQLRVVSAIRDRIKVIGPEQQVRSQTCSPIPMSSWLPPTVRGRTWRPFARRSLPARCRSRPRSAAMSNWSGTASAACSSRPGTVTLAGQIQLGRGFGCVKASGAVRQVRG